MKLLIFTPGVSVALEIKDSKRRKTSQTFEISLRCCFAIQGSSMGSITQMQSENLHVVMLLC